ncbi:polyprenyl synthetase family protein [Salinarchaeum sp. IM2453]|uniref:polyprenyl synthetase family protein n=1 Tax=Salinarchaeum sp. IM2453 TaxID=2862870 RepID=UPI001C82865C|nr:polyprenyl synthetase family protein [Salinarchaeum sp. IM2453]QZA88011.1 polyprenyl synthetase family protein [Salinarchaeum sp. IM2453]
MRDTLADWRPDIDQAIEEVIPREVSEEYLDEFFGTPTYQYDARSVQKALSDPIWNLLDRGGKRWRSVLFLVFVEAFGEDPNEYLPYAIIPEILHNGTIIVDDVEDEAAMRRGEPAVHKQFGVDIALNAGNAMYFIPLKIITKNPGNLDPELRLRAYEMLMYELNRTHIGQGMDICWHNDEEIEVGEPEYLEMCACKTGCLGRIVARLAAIVTEQSKEVEHEAARYAEKVSVAFQIGDDILDVENSLGQAGDFGKEFGNDIREGKTTLMAIHAVETAPKERARRLQRILAAEENTNEEIIEAIDILQETDSIAYAKDIALDLAAEAREHIHGLDLQPEPKDQLLEFTEFVVKREK